MHLYGKVPFELPGFCQCLISAYGKLTHYRAGLLLEHGAFLRYAHPAFGFPAKIVGEDLTSTGLLSSINKTRVALHECVGRTGYDQLLR